MFGSTPRLRGRGFCFAGGRVLTVWVDGARDPRLNMERDGGLLAAAERGAQPVLRLYSFAPHGITLGYGQDPGRELDLARCERDGVPWAIRPTGGRAIFHAQEWTYSLAAPIDDPHWGGSLAPAYLRVSELIARALRRLGVPAELAARSPRAAAGVGGSHGPWQAADACFASTARHEIVAEGRKLVGSAQRRTARGLLQQGSVLLGDGHLRLADYVQLEAARRERFRSALANGATGAGAWLGSDRSLERWAAAIEREAPAGTRRVGGDAGANLLTPAKTGSYTSAA